MEIHNNEPGRAGYVKSLEALSTPRRAAGLAALALAAISVSGCSSTSTPANGNGNDAGYVAPPTGGDDGSASSDDGTAPEAAVEASSDGSTPDASFDATTEGSIPDSGADSSDAEGSTTDSQAPGTCRATGSMATPRRWSVGNSGAVLLGNSSVLVVGGLDSSTGHVVASAELYGAATGMWSGTGGMSVARGGVVGVTLADGRVLVLGGWSQITSLSTSTGVVSYNGPPLKSAEIYDPTSGVFTPTGNLTTPRAWPGLALLPNGDVLVVSGISAVSPQYTGAAEIYNTTSSDGGGAGTFASAGTLPNAVAGYPLAVTLHSGKALVFMLAGVAGTTVTGGPAFVFDPTSNTFTPGIGDLIEANRGILLEDGDAFFVGGLNSGAATAQTELYKAAAGTWQLGGNMTVVRSAASLANLPNGDVLVVGGCQQTACGNSVLASAEICSP